MKSYKFPSREKIHEALSAVADNRIILKDNQAEVSSSDNTKKYIVEWQDNIYSSNDNASYWQGYVGYPIIAILLLNKQITYDNSILEHFKNINWKQLNAKYKNNYVQAVEELYTKLKVNNIDVNHIDNEINNIFDQLSKLDIDTKRSSYFPPR